MKENRMNGIKKDHAKNKQVRYIKRKEGVHMDELLYLLALIVGIAGALTIWGYARSKQRAAVRVIQKEKTQEGNEKSRDEYD
jgi:hypothetical protein